MMTRHLFRTNGNVIPTRRSKSRTFSAALLILVLLATFALVKYQQRRDLERAQQHADTVLEAYRAGLAEGLQKGLDAQDGDVFVIELSPPICSGSNAMGGV